MKKLLLSLALALCVAMPAFGQVGVNSLQLNVRVEKPDIAQAGNLKYSVELYDLPDPAESFTQTCSWSGLFAQGQQGAGFEVDYAMPTKGEGPSIIQDTLTGFSAQVEAANPSFQFYAPGATQRYLIFEMQMPAGYTYQDKTFASENASQGLAFLEGPYTSTFAQPWVPITNGPVLSWVIPAPIGGLWTGSAGNTYNFVGYTFVLTPITTTPGATPH